MKEYIKTFVKILGILFLLMIGSGVIMIPGFYLGILIVYLIGLENPIDIHLIMMVTMILWFVACLVTHLEVQSRKFNKSQE